MALAPIRPVDLPHAVTVYASDRIPTDDGVTVSGATPVQIADAGAPIASQATAIAGVNATERMTPLTTRQVLDFEIAPAVLRAQAWAESATAPDPLLPTSKSSKTWAMEAAASAVIAQAYGGLPFTTRAAAIAATIPVGITAISVLHDGQWLNYAYDATGTAMTTAGGRNWSPAGKAMLGHWGAIGDGADTLAGWKINRRAWVTATAYAVNDILWVSKVGYRCIVAHTSAAAFATDLAAGRWVQGAFSGTDATAACLAALTWLSPRKQSLYLRDSSAYRFANQNLSDAGYITVPDYVSIISDGSADLLIDEDPAYYNGSTGGKNAVFLFDSGVSSTGYRLAKEKAEFINVFFRGRWSHANAKTGVNAVRMEGFKEVIFDGGGAYDIRNKTTRCKSNGGFRVVNTHSERCARGFWRSQDTDNFYVVGNYMADGDDDAIDCHSSDTSLLQPARSVATICDNTLINCEGIVGLGLKMGMVRGNVCKLVHGSIIAVGSGVDPEGNTASILLDVSHNLITDPLERYDAGAFAASNVNQGSVYVAGGKKSSASTSGIVPGDYSGATLAFIPPYTASGTTPKWGAMWAGDAFDEGGDPTVYSSPGGLGVTIVDNQIYRTLPDLAKFSDAGFGFYFQGEDGYVDPAVTGAAYKANGVILLGDMSDFTVSGNKSRGLTNSGIWFRGASALDRKVAFRNGIVAGNIISDCGTYGIGKDGTGGAPAFADYDDWTIRFESNKIDVDPRHVATIRTTPLDGTWQSSGALIYLGVFWRHGKNASFLKNEFSNCYRPIQGNNTEWDQFHMEGNVVRCKPSDVVWNAANIGVGVPETGGGLFIHIIEDGDPRNFATTYGKLLNTCPIALSAVPTAGTFVKGHFIRKTNPTTASSKTLMGWLRETTGSGHTVATTATADWAPIVATTS